MICPPGSYYDAVNGCSTCNKGQFCPLAIAGHRPSSIGTELDCPDGTYSLDGATECSLCKPGKDCSDKQSLGSNCAAGHYQVGGSMTCTVCPKNHECSDNGATIAPCPLYFYAESPTDLGVCKPCEDGKDCRDTLNDPVDCI